MKKSKEKKIFYCITTNSFYLAKHSITTTLRITKEMPWICVQEFNAFDDIFSCSFLFNNGKLIDIKLRFEKKGSYHNFVMLICTLLKSMLPKYHPLKINVPSTFVVEPTKPKHTQLVTLFISQMKLKNLNVDVSFVSHLKHELKKERPLEMDASIISLGELQALSVALCYSTSIKEVKCGGKGFKLLYKHIGTAISQNYGINNLEVFKYKSSKEFNYFLQKLEGSKIQSLTFTDVILTPEMGISFIQNLSKSNVEVLAFDNSCCIKSCIEQFSLTPDSFKFINSFILKNEEDVQNNIHIFSKLVISSSLKSLTITNCNLDIADFFELISLLSEHIQLMYIDLSKNRCSDKFKGSYIIPKTLTKLVLNKIHWEGQSYLTLLTKQTYNSLIDLSIANPKVNPNDLTSLITSLSNNSLKASINSLCMDKSIISSSLFSFLSNNQNLQILSISKCHYPSTEKKTILSSLANFIKNSSISSLSIKQTMQKMKSKLLIELKDALIEHPYFSSLEIDNNSIGDEGIQVLYQILSKNNNINGVSFDGAELSSPAILLSFINRISSKPHSNCIKKPKDDISKYVSKIGTRFQKEFKNSWAKYKSSISKTFDNDDDDEYSEQSTSNSQFYLSGSLHSFSQSNSTQNDEFQSSGTCLSHLETSWDFDIEIPDENQEDWKLLEKKFSYQRLLGLSEKST